MKVIPTIFAKNKKQFQERFEKLLPVSKNLQIDFMDGKFVKSKSVMLAQIPNLKKYKNNFEAHMMILYPQKRIPKLSRLGFKKFIFHVSAVKNSEQVIERARTWGLAPWIAVNPEVKLHVVLPYLTRASGVLFMGVHPGKEKQKFILSTLTKIRKLRAISKTIKIQVDGGVNEKTAKQLAEAGVDYINSGSFISEAENPKEALKKLQAAFKPKQHAF